MLNKKRVLPFKYTAVAIALSITHPVIAASETDVRLDKLEQRLAELEQKLLEKDQKIVELERKNTTTQQQAEPVTETIVVFPSFAERSSHKFTAPNKSIRLTDSDTTLQIGGQIWLDAIYNSGEMTNRAGFQTSAIAYDDGVTNDDTLLNAGQSKLSIQSHTPTKYGAMKTRFEFDMFQSDGSAGFHLTHLWGELGNWGAGQTFSGFTDINAFPNIIDYWGPNSMAFARQPQLRYTHTPSQSDQFIFTLERSDSDLAYPNFIGAEDIVFNEKNDFADLTAGYINTLDNGYFKAAMILRSIGYETASNDDSVLGWGINVSGNYALDKANTLKYQVVTGEGIGRYMNDPCCSLYAASTGGSDAGLNSDNDLEAIGITGGFVYLDHSWSEEYTSSVGVSYVDVDNLSTQFSRALNKSLYTTANLIWNPTPMSRVGFELQYGEVESFGGEDADNIRFQTSVGFKY